MVGCRGARLCRLVRDPRLRSESASVSYKRRPSSRRLVCWIRPRGLGALRWDRGGVVLLSCMMTEKLWLESLDETG